ncbi:hypothetical protein ASE25_22100 [Terrabacter sp. Root85]|uniref:AAA family ATPase n=1 Tax=Terrabacter sp. Root85 TaxID=1736603 RepID=UPI0006FBAD77|nr:AAA family ATPase [Terrabacter sp. Root85]KRC90859.1 hypothetical protein ASE25_22100 [Terrabacter sp. Root85]
MATMVILVNGLPGSGKSTLAIQLADALSVPVLSKDAIKESVADALEWPVELSGPLGAASMEMAWSLAATLKGTVVLESWWFRPRDLGHAQRAIERIGSPRVVEIWCTVAPGIARTRVQERQRHRIHPDADRLAMDWPKWSTQARPLGLGPVVPVETGTPVNMTALIEELRTLLA